MKKVLGTMAAVIILVAAFPMAASAVNVKPGSCRLVLRPCPTSMPPASIGGNSNGTRSGGGGSSTGTGRGTGTGGGRTMPPASLPPIGR